MAYPLTAHRNLAVSFPIWPSTLQGIGDGAEIRVDDTADVPSRASAWHAIQGDLCCSPCLVQHLFICCFDRLLPSYSKHRNIAIHWFKTAVDVNVKQRSRCAMQRDTSCQVISNQHKSSEKWSGLAEKWPILSVRSLGGSPCMIGAAPCTALVRGAPRIGRWKQKLALEQL